MGELMRALNTGELKAHASDIAKLLPRLLKDPGKLGGAVASQEIEHKTLLGAVKELEESFGCKVEVFMSKDVSHPKALQGMPGKPAVVVE